MTRAIDLRGGASAAQNVLTPARSMAKHIDTNWDRMAATWRDNLVSQLQERCGLAEEEARRKVELWLDGLKERPYDDP